MNETDRELLRRYVRDHSEDAFAEIVRRHLNLVHSAAVRQVRSPQLAEEVAQSAFTDLARNGARLKPDTILTAWLYHVTRRTAIDVVRREARRQLREQIASEMSAMNATATDWTHIEPLLDEAMHALDETDRTAVLLRYFENKSLREVGQALGTSDDAAQKRVSRAVERLREFFAKHDATVGAGALVAVISANAVQAAPAGLAVTISTAAALAGTTISTAAIAATAKAIAMTTLQKTLVAVTIGAAVGTGIYEARQASNLKSQVQTLQHQQALLAEQVEQLARERDDTTRQLATLREENAQLNRNAAELLRLRGEVTRLRDATRGTTRSETDPVVQQALEWKAKERRLRQLFDERPDQRVPEMLLLSDRQWFEAARDADLDSETGVRRALSKVRQWAKSSFGSQMQQALKKYVEANSNQLPEDLAQLKPYFLAQVDDSILQQYKVVISGKLSEENIREPIVTDKAVIDEEYDLPITINTYISTFQMASRDETKHLLQELDPVFKAYADANGGLPSTDHAQLQPYVKTPGQEGALKRLLQIEARAKRQ